MRKLIETAKICQSEDFLQLKQYTNVPCYNLLFITLINVNAPLVATTKIYTS